MSVGQLFVLIGSNAISLGFLAVALNAGDKSVSLFVVGGLWAAWGFLRDFESRFRVK